MDDLPPAQPIESVPMQYVSEDGLLAFVDEDGAIFITETDTL